MYMTIINPKNTCIIHTNIYIILEVKLLKGRVYHYSTQEERILERADYNLVLN